MLVQLVRTKSKNGKSITDGKSHDLLWSQPLVIALTIGIVPCPVTSVILIFCLAGLIWQGIALVASFAMGMGISIFVISLLVWLFKEKIAEKRSTAFQSIITTILPILGGIFFVFSGCSILLSL